MTGDNGARDYAWLNLRRVRKAEDPDLAATAARLYAEREQYRAQAEQRQVAVEAMHDELRRQKPLVDAALDLFDPDTGNATTAACNALKKAAALYREPVQ